jgi:putative PIN family toxin of toxin-antitoxin system
MERTRVVLDTNILISAIVFGGLPRKILEMVIVGSVNCSLSFAILDELRDVLQRSKFGFSPQQAATVIDELQDICEILNPPRRIRTIKADPDDNRILECAVEAQAMCIISGDNHLLELGKYREILIYSPADFLTTLQ